MAEQAVTDVRDVRVLIPRVRRAIDGPEATGSGSVAASLTDDMMVGLIADAVADVILLTGGFFGYSLEVVDRDDIYMAPTAWRTDRERSSSADTVISAQAAINYFFHKLRDMKFAETIKDESQEWSWQKSASLVRDQMRNLAEMRDRALASIQAQGVALDAYISFVAERDVIASRYIEPWVDSGSGLGGQELDVRFR